MPMQRERYPDDWEAISLAIRERAGWRCETCAAPNGALICRSKAEPFNWRLLEYGESEEYAANGWHDEEWFRPVKVILTVHHRGVPYPDGTPGDPHDKLDVRPENLAALCQRCHWIEDLPIHIEKAHLARRARKLAAGQIEMWEGDDAHA